MKDDALLLLAARYHDCRQRVKELEAEADEMKAELVDELERVDRAGHFEGNGWKVSRVVNHRTSYDYELAKAGWRPAVLRRVMIRSVDKAKVAEEIDAGRLPVLAARAAAVVVTSAPYPRVTPPAESDPKAA